MANTTISPNMLMPVPVVSVDPGPDWATNVNACLSAIDSHDHSAGKGVTVTPAGLNINSALPFNANPITNLGYLTLTNQAAPLTGASYIGGLYQVLGDLWWTNGADIAVQLTFGNNSLSSILAPTQLIAVNSSVTLTNKTIHLVTTASPLTLTLPVPAITNFITIKDASGGAEANPITVARYAAEMIDGVAGSFTCNSSYGSWSFVSDGTNWFVT